MSQTQEQMRATDGGPVWANNGVVLISGGLDSCVALALAQQQMAVKLLLSINYGQRHSRELESARAISAFYNIPWRAIDVPIGPLIQRGSALVNADEPLPEGRTIEEMSSHIPRSYAPGRNTMMIAIASSIAEAWGCNRIVTGFNCLDYSGYPDCRPEFVEAWNRLALLATAQGVNGSPIFVTAPIIHMTKVEIIQAGLDHKAPLYLTWSCYKGEARPCGTCDSCIIRGKAFDELGVEDPAR